MGPGALTSALLQFSGQLGGATTPNSFFLANDADAPGFLGVGREYPAAAAVVLGPLFTNVPVPLPAGVTVDFDLVVNGGASGIMTTYVAGESGVKAGPGVVALAPGDTYALRANVSGVLPADFPLFATVAVT